jgi:hypothetical protein
VKDRECRDIRTAPNRARFTGARKSQLGRVLTEITAVFELSIKRAAIDAVAGSVDFEASRRLARRPSKPQTRQSFRHWSDPAENDARRRGAGPIALQPCTASIKIIHRSSSTSPASRPTGVKRRSALSMRKRSRCRRVT